MKRKNIGLHHQRGQGAVEYALLLSLIVLASILSLNLLGISVSDVYCNVAKNFGSEGAACSAQKVYCSDSFDEDLSGWKSLMGKPSIQEGQMCFSGGLQNLNQCSTNMKRNDYVVALSDVVLKQGDGYGVYFRSSDNGMGINGYAFQYDPGLKSKQNPNGAYVIRKWVNGREISQPIVTAPLSGADTYNQPHNIEISAVGDVFTVLVDGQKTLSFQDDTYTSGGSGIRSWDSTSACMGDFSVLESPK